VQGLCIKLPDYCTLLSSSLICAQCTTNYTLWNGICYQTIPNCVVQNGTYCVQCSQLYTLSTDQKSCISKQTIRYCTQYDSTYSYCLICQTGFSVTTDGYCLAQHCSKYDLTTYICLQCLNETINGIVYYYALQN
jgi:hypothetical protein